jgi:hypothetical protein
MRAHNQISLEGRDGTTALIKPLSQVHGLSSKLWSMSLATLLLGLDNKRTLWRDVGGDMIAVDSLVHGFLTRSGILRGLNAEHPYLTLSKVCCNRKSWMAATRVGESAIYAVNIRAGRLPKPEGMAAAT